MKITCETNVAPRNSNAKGRFQRTNLALVKKKGSDKAQIVVVLNNKSQTVYDLNNNVANVFKRFIDEGKCTISFKTPEIDLQIKADAIQLKAFLNAIKCELCPSEASTEKPLQVTTKLNSVKAPTNEIVTRLVIKSRAGFAAKGFPRTLKELTINNVGCSQMPIGILNLTNLNTLDLTNNKIEKLPKALGKLRLSKIMLDQNQLSESSPLDWAWLRGSNIRESLNFLSISKNELPYFPPSIVDCVNMVQLDLSSNRLQALPSAMKALQKLRYLNLSSNLLTRLPYTMTTLKLEVIDVGTNAFAEIEPEVLKHGIKDILREFEPRTLSLFDIAASVIIKSHIPYMSHNIPLILKEILACAPICANSRCEKFCSDGKLYNCVVFIEPTAKKLFTSDNKKRFLSDGAICSLECVQTIMKRYCHGEG